MRDARVPATWAPRRAPRRLPPPEPRRRPPVHCPPYAGRYARYRQEVGSGRFKTVYKGFDQRHGIDVAWSKIDAAQNDLAPDQTKRVVEEISYGLGLDHPHIIKCYQCWEDPSSSCINMVTEFFTSGNLRDYRQRHRALDIKAVRKWARQVLLGLAYLHSRTTPVVHGDLRCAFWGGSGRWERGGWLSPSRVGGPAGRGARAGVAPAGVARTPAAAHDLIGSDRIACS